MLDHLVSELDTRFNEPSSRFLSQFIQLLPTEICKPHARITHLDFNELLQFYDDDFPFFRGFPAEFYLWKNYWYSERCISYYGAEKLNTPEKALQNADKDIYPNVYVFLVLAGTIPVTSCECDRSISIL